MHTFPHQSIGFLETTGLTPALVAVDAMEKTASVKILQAEINDFLGICIKLVGPTAAIKAAIDAGKKVAEQMGGQPVVHIINRPDQNAWQAIESPREFNPLIQQDVVFVLFPNENQPVDNQPESKPDNSETYSMQDNDSFALGFIETQGFTAVFEAIDSACKAANVEVLGKEKLGGGYVTVVIKGDVAAVTAAIEAGSSKVEGLGKLIASHVIPRPSKSVWALLPKI